MIRFFILKFKSGFYVGLLAILNIAAVLVTPSCNSTENKKGNNSADSINKVKKVNDSIAREKHIQDSVANVERIKDSIIKADSIKKSNRIYEHKIQNPKYGVIRTDYKEM